MRYRYGDGSLFDPVKLGPLQLANRIVMASLTRNRSSEEGVPPDFAALYYAQRAETGLLISAATNISPQARGYAMTPGIWLPEQVSAWSKVTEAVHGRGGKMFLQLGHTGRLSHPDLHNGETPVAPSAIKPLGQAFTATGLKDFVTPRALKEEEIGAIVDDYYRAALGAKVAGFDGVEIHSANNYLLEQFIRDTTNIRTDRYGGSIENRLRFPMEVVEAVKSAWGGGERVGIRISPATTMPGNTPLDTQTMATYGAYVDALSKAGLVYLHVIEGITQTTREVPAGIDFPALRKRFAGAYMANNEYTLELAEHALAAQDADLFSFGRAFIANPDLITRLKTGAPLADAPKRYWFGGGAVGYCDWPRMDSAAA
jgi:N-ethylmaleimide reductase